MRIIKYGTNPPAPPPQVICERCKSVLEIAPPDIQDNNAIGTWVVCPVCSGHVQVQMSIIPKEWRKLINWDE